MHGPHCGVDVKIIVQGSSSGLWISIFDYTNKFYSTEVVYLKKNPPPSLSSIAVHLGGSLLGWRIFEWWWTHNLHHERLHTTMTAIRMNVAKPRVREWNMIGETSWAMQFNLKMSLAQALSWKLFPITILITTKVFICFFCNSKRSNYTTIGHDWFQHPLHTSNLFYMSRGAQIFVIPN